MGLKLAEFFTEAERLGGMQGKLKLAGLTKMTSVQADAIEDTPALVLQFEKAMNSIRTDPRRAAAPTRETTTVAGDVRTLRKHIQGYFDLMTQRALMLGDVTETAKRIDEVACDVLDVARVSIWHLDEKRTKISCVDLYERAAKKHTSGVELFAKDFPPYFAALGTERTIAAHDAHTDPRTSCFSQVYLKPLGINSMLDVPIWLDGNMYGVVCHEHVGPMRQWNLDEEKFAYLMANFVSMAAERAKGTHVDKASF
jgi:hypothetical protein